MYRIRVQTDSLGFSHSHIVAVKVINHTDFILGKQNSRFSIERFEINNYSVIIYKIFKVIFSVFDFSTHILLDVHYNGK
jgi:hypothetical protein